MNIDLRKQNIRSAHKSLVHGDFSVEELCNSYLKNIEEKNPQINAFLEVFDDVIDQARRAQKMINDETSTMLTGIPIAVKDNILIEGKKAQAASKILTGYKATYSATAIKKLQEAGAILIGRTNMDEFAMGSSTENSAFGPTKNPLDQTRVPGGSSGGSAAAIAMDGAIAALGSDTAGSVRQPAAFCGCVGLKTTYGSVSRHGLIALGSSLDQIGPLSKTVGDSEIIFNAIRGQDPYDSTTISDSFYAESRAKRQVVDPKLVIGVPRHLVEAPGIDDDVVDNFNQSVNKLKNLGYKIKEIELPHVQYSLAAYYILLPGEASSNLARFDGVKYGLRKSGEKLIDDYLESRGEGFGPEPRRRILLGTYVLSAGYYDAFYNKAQMVRTLIAEDFVSVWKEVDAIIFPTTPTPAFKLGEKVADPVSMYRADVFTVPSNIVGIPTVAVPSGSVVRDGINLPLGIQFLSPQCREDVLFKIGKDFLEEE